MYFFILRSKRNNWYRMMFASFGWRKVIYVFAWRYLRNIESIRNSKILVLSRCSTCCASIRQTEFEVTCKVRISNPSFFLPKISCLLVTRIASWFLAEPHISYLCIAHVRMYVYKKCIKENIIVNKGNVFFYNRRDHCNRTHRIYNMYYK